MPAEYANFVKVLGDDMKSIYNFHYYAKRFGRVKLKDGGVIFRNYGRELKNGKGFHIFDMMDRKAANLFNHAFTYTSIE